MVKFLEIRLAIWSHCLSVTFLLHWYLSQYVWRHSNCSAFLTSPGWVGWLPATRQNTRHNFWTTRELGKGFSKKLTNPDLFFIFLSFQTQIEIFQQINVKKCPSSKWCKDSNSQPLEHESPPITTRQGLPPNGFFLGSDVCQTNPRSS